MPSREPNPRSIKRDCNHPERQVRVTAKSADGLTLYGRCQSCGERVKINREPPPPPP